MATANEQADLSESEETLINTTFKLLKSGEKEIQLKNQYKEIVLVVGPTGNGKSKYTRWIAGDDAYLISKETVEDTGEYIIDDIHENSSSTITSDTVYPSLLVDIEANVPYYDCSGFNDSRSVSNDIATTYFIKKIVDHADSVKIIFIINYPSVRKGVDRHNFMQLMKHATEFTKNVEKYKNSIALVVTKVDNTHIFRKGEIVFVDDSKVVAAIADFLEEVKKEVAVKVLNSTSMEKRFYEAVIKFILYFLKKDGEKYTNIGVFRRPDQPGPLNEIPLLLKGKENIKTLIYKNLTFSKKADDDFGYTISVNSKYIIGRLVEEINKCVYSSVRHITEEITGHYSTLTNEIRKTIKSFANADLVADTDQLLDEKLSSHLREGHKSILVAIQDIERVRSPYELAQKIKRFMIYSDNLVSEKYILSIENQGKYFDFLQVLSEEQLSIPSWNELFQRVENFLSDFGTKIQEDIDEVAPCIQKHILCTFEWISKDLQNQLDEKMKELEIQEIPEILKNYSNSVMCMVERLKNAMSITEYLKIIRDVMGCINISVPNDSALKIIKLDGRLKFLQNFSEKNCCTLLLVHPFQNLFKHLSESKTWYNFLNSIYHTFSEYKIQKNKENYNVADLENWGKSKTTRGIFITQKNFQQFLQNIFEYNIGDRDNIKKITPTEIWIEELNQVLNLTLKKQIKMGILQPLIFVTGDYIKISDILNDPDSSSFLKLGGLKSIYIFATRTIFIDEDLNLPSSNLGIMAPKWEIIGRRKICLDGAAGEPHSSDKANGIGSTGKGKPGLPGKHGGTFFGIGEEFVNGTHFTITANGGDGGPGQHGGNGQEGVRGENAEMPTSDDSPSQREIEEGIRSIGGFSCEKTGGTGSVYVDMDVHGIGIVGEVVMSNFARKSTAEYDIFGSSGGRGGDGGDGGKGGEGGNPGFIDLYELNTNSGISKFSKGGKCGRDGEGGKGGQGGEGGRNISARCRMFRPGSLLDLMGAEIRTEWELIARRRNDVRGTSGTDGVDGANIMESLSPEPANKFPEALKIVNKYKEYLVENLNCRFKRLSLLSFLNKINEDNDIKRSQ